MAWVAVTPAASLALYLALPAQTIGSPLLCLHRSTTCCAASAIHRPCGCAPSRARLRPHQGTIFTGSGCSWCGGGSQTLPGPPVPVPRPSPRSPVYPPISVPPAPSIPSWLVQNIDLTLANSSMQIRLLMTDRMGRSVDILNVSLFFVCSGVQALSVRAQAQNLKKSHNATPRTVGVLYSLFGGRGAGGSPPSLED